MAYDGTIAAITLAGSSLSALSTACVLICFIVYNKTQRSLRHFLVLNLTVSGMIFHNNVGRRAHLTSQPDFINSTAMATSGAIYMRDHKLVEGPACTLNGWLGQISVQATDFSILAISIVTLLVVRQKARLTRVSALKTTLICASTWIMPLISSTTVVAMGEMKPVSGNWCWLSKKRTDLRYGVAHAWRFAIIFITVGIYTYIWWHVSRHFRFMRNVTYGSASRSSRLQSIRSKLNGTSRGDKIPEDENSTELRVGVDRQFRVKSSDEESQISQSALVLDDAVSSTPYAQDRIASPAPNNKVSYHAAVSAKSTPWRATESDEAHNTAAEHMRNNAKQTERDVKRMLLLNGYPIMFVILWIPGLTNRILEASGSTNSSRVLNILQCSTQYVGFANAVTYGLSGIWRAGR